MHLKKKVQPDNKSYKLNNAPLSVVVLEEIAVNEISH
jgi:hypothetical protein